MSQNAENKPDEVISLEQKLTEHWLEHREACERGIAQADRNLGRIATAYSKQLHFDFLAAESGQTA